MTEPDSHYPISDLIARKISGTLTEAGAERLNEWLAASAANQRLYDSIVDSREWQDRDAYAGSLNTDKAWQDVRTRIVPDTRSRRLWLTGIAASMLLILTIGGAWLYTHTSPQPASPPAIATTGGHQAILITENGGQIVLQDSTVREIHSSEGIRIENSGHDIVYRIADTASVATREIYNTIVVPKGGEYRLTLADGSKAWLNSESELYFPVAFNGAERHVYLKGEAYFQVQKDNSRAFIVHAGNQTSIEVLGTEFNVEAYPAESVMRTTLNHGKVRIIRNHKSVILLPDQQAIYQAGSILPEIRPVVASNYSAWKDGKLIFEDARLEAIMARLSRWYSLNVFFTSEDLKDYHFTGDLEKYGDFTTALHMLEKATRIKFETSGNTVVIRKIN